MLDGLADMYVPRSQPHCPSSSYGTGRQTAEVERLQQLTHHLTIHHRPGKHAINKGQCGMLDGLADMVCQDPTPLSLSSYGTGRQTAEVERLQQLTHHLTIHHRPGKHAINKGTVWDAGWWCVVVCVVGGWLGGFCGGVKGQLDAGWPSRHVVPRSQPHCPSSSYGTGRQTAEVERLQQLTHHLTIHHRPADMYVPRSQPHCPSSSYGTGRQTAEVERLQQLTHHLTIHHRPGKHAINKGTVWDAGESGKHGQRRCKSSAILSTLIRCTVIEPIFLCRDVFSFDYWR
ncbi:hypothetical protein J6590_051179 [Homalodisca vitripennis]|nr:hypothetical protein J6590_051179 [Homalodisca vitripennis]